MSDLNAQSQPSVTIIDANQSRTLLLHRELFQYRDLFYFFVWRNIKTRYAQSILGVGWAVIQPLFTMVVFTIVFGNLARVASDGVPYAIFSFTALVPWTFFSQALTQSTGSLISASNMLNKVYFPRILIPLAPIMSKLVDFLIAFALLVCMMFFYPVQPTLWVLILPLLVLLLMLTASGMGLWLSALAVQYRDVNYAMAFAVQLLMYAAPVVYPTSNVPEQFRLAYGLFPMVGVIEGFRAALLGSSPMPWDLLAVGTGSGLLLFVSGAIYFRRTETIFADVV